MICFKIYYFYINILFIHFSNKDKLSYNFIFWVLLIFQKNIIHLSINLSINLGSFFNFSELLICMNGSIFEYNIFNKIIFKMFISAFPIFFYHKFEICADTVFVLLVSFSLSTFDFISISLYTNIFLSIKHKIKNIKYIQNRWIRS